MQQGRDMCLLFHTWCAELLSGCTGIHVILGLWSSTGFCNTSKSNILNLYGNIFVVDKSIIVRITTLLFCCIVRLFLWKIRHFHLWCISLAWWRHQMGTFSALRVLCAEKSSVTGEFPTQNPVTRSFDVFFDLCLNERLSKQAWGW